MRRRPSEAAFLPESVFIYQITVNLYRTLVYLHLSYNVLIINLMLSLPHEYRYNYGGDNQSGVGVGINMIIENGGPWVVTNGIPPLAPHHCMTFISFLG